MSYKITIASGKGGTGKTTVAVNLFHKLNYIFRNKVQLVDCDVEEPNDIIFFPDAIKIKETNAFQFIPEIDKDKCIYCNKCSEYCEFNAIVIIPHIKYAEVNTNLCHSCGACSLACKDDAIKEKKEMMGSITTFITPGGNSLLEGRLKIGSSMQTMLIGELKKYISNEEEIILYDAPPGTSCPVVETIHDADYVILVTEPTPFGLYDLQLMVELLEEINKPFGVIVNKSGLGNDNIYSFLEDKRVELLGEIPFMKKYAECYANGDLTRAIPKEISNAYTEIVDKLEEKLLVHEGNNYFKW